MNTSPKIKTADMKQYRRNYRAARKARGVCIYCGKPLPSERKTSGFVSCRPCSILQS
jgi:hypothetical protein